MAESSDTGTVCADPQWVVDPGDASHIVYWDGCAYIAERRWDGQGWVEPPSVDRETPARERVSSRHWRIWLVATVLVVVVAPVIWFGLTPTAVPSDLTRTASIATADMAAGRYVNLCSLALPDQDAKCINDMGAIPSGIIVYSDLTLGSVVASGDQAIATLIGSACVKQARCWSNHQSDLVGRQGQSFGQLYASAMGSAPSSPFILPLVQQDGRWYITGF